METEEENRYPSEKEVSHTEDLSGQEGRARKVLVPAIFVFGTLSILSFLAWQLISFSAAPAERSVACTTEAKLCPDGSSVGRTGPDCDFAKCPEAVEPLGVESRDTAASTSENHKGVSMDFVLSSLSAPRAKIDLFWDYELPPEEVERQGGRGTRRPAIGIAEPLHLIESFTIQNESAEPLYLHSIANEQMTYIDVEATYNLEKATPLMLLPDAFTDQMGRVHGCVERTVLAAMQGSYFTSAPNNLPDMNNVCEFAEPITVPEGETLALSPVPYIVSYGLLGEMVNNPFQDDERFFKAKLETLGEERWFIPHYFEKYDDVLEADTFNVGGYIVTNTTDIDLLNNIFDLRTGAGGAATFSRGVVQTGVPLQSYEIPLSPFVANTTTVFSEEVLGLQVFLYLNDFINREQVSGLFDTPTLAALKSFQREAAIYPSGVFDVATAHAIRGRQFTNLIRYYENYGDAVVTLGLGGDTGFFRYWGAGGNEVIISDDQTSTADIRSYDSIPDAHGSRITYVDGRTKSATFRHFLILNNTAATVTCTVSLGNAAPIEKFAIESNELHRFHGERDSISEAGLYDLQCDGKRVQVELTENEQVGRG